jgi:hypothetical protein
MTGVIPPKDAVLALALQIREEERLQDEENAHYIARIRAGFDTVAGGFSTKELTRHNAVYLLKIISEVLAPFTSKTNDTFENVGVYVTDHAAIDLLNRLIDAIEDLDRGITHEILKSTKGGGNALPAHERKRDDALIGAVTMVQFVKKLPTRSLAQAYVANALKRNNKTIRGAKPSAQRLKKILDHQVRPSRAKQNQNQQDVQNPIAKRPRGRPKIDKD